MKEKELRLDNVFVIQSADKIYIQTASTSIPVCEGRWKNHPEYRECYEIVQGNLIFEYSK